MLSYPSGMSVSHRALNVLAEPLRHERRVRRTRWRRLEAGQQALAYLRKGETYADLAVGFGIGITTVFRYIREALQLLAARTAGLSEAITTAARKAFVIIDGTLLRIDRVGMASGRDRPLERKRTIRPQLDVQLAARYRVHSRGADCCW
ncbi:transposase family protein [Saccharopolyspora sp. NPDC049357]|uniref:helix-turn-helix domain-containing protein n=1 Tax=Saccharopolyspora sp. NPDC049357 TaxID=3154507 RepID=UPI003432ACD2